MLLTELFDRNLNERGGARVDSHMFKAIFVVGSPGAGKNTIARMMGLISHGLRPIDIDFTKGALERITKKHISYDDAWGTHSKYQSSMADIGMGMAIFTTGRNVEQVASVNNVLLDSGYQTGMLFIDIDYSKALDNVEYRAEKETDIANKGRVVDIDYLNDAYDAIEENADVFEQMFGPNFFYIANDVPREKMRSKVLNSDAFRKISRFMKLPHSDIAANQIEALFQYNQ